MSSITVILAGGVVLAALIGAALARGLPPQTLPPSRHGPLQGFRGLLALGVFVHHTFIWFHYTHGQRWVDSEVWRQFGESRVVLFFMLASALFYGRLLDARDSDFDWLRLYVSRLFRLAPAYWLAMGLMLVVLALATTWRIDGAGTGIALRSWPDIIGASAIWLAFSMLGMPAIDAYMNTPLITAGVTWTMPFELTFYLLLPLLALPLRVRMPLATLGLGLAAAMWLAAWAPNPVLLGPFVGGMAVALAMRAPRVAQALRHPAYGAAALAALTCVIFVLPMAYAPLPLLLQAFALAVVAAGNDLFGMLRLRAPQALGSWAYSLYLLHGIALYTLFLLVIGAQRAAGLSALEYAVVIALFTPVVLALAWASQRWIETPPMRAVPFVVALLRRLMTRPDRRGAEPEASSFPSGV